MPKQYLIVNGRAIAEMPDPGLEVYAESPEVAAVRHGLARLIPRLTLAQLVALEQAFARARAGATVTIDGGAQGGTLRVEGR